MAGLDNESDVCSAIVQKENFRLPRKKVEGGEERGPG